MLEGKSFAILGLGGVANNVLQHLLAFNPRRLLLIDFDTVQPTDLHRQLFYAEGDVGRSKAQCLEEAIQKRYPFVEIDARDLRLESIEQILQLIAGYDFVLRSADSPPEIDNWINDACLAREIPFLISGTMEQKGLLGPLVVPFETACVNCSETVEFSDQVGEEKRRTVLFYNSVTPVIGPMVSLLGDFVAAEIFNHFSQPEACRLTRGFYLFDFITLGSTFLHTRRDATGCPSCGTRENLAALVH